MGVRHLRESEMTILRRTERAMVRAMCGAKLMEMLGLKETAVQMAEACSEISVGV